MSLNTKENWLNSRLLYFEESTSIAQCVCVSLCVAGVWVTTNLFLKRCFIRHFRSDNKQCVLANDLCISWMNCRNLLLLFRRRRKNKNIILRTHFLTDKRWEFYGNSIAFRLYLQFCRFLYFIHTYKDKQLADR